MIFFLIGLFSTIIGSIVGIGGGLIIRPALAGMGAAKSLASFTSSIVVLSMSSVTLITYIRKKVHIKIKKILILAAGSIIGGFLGGTLLKFVSESFIDRAYIFMLILVLLSVVYRNKIPKMNIKNPFLQFFIGIITGGLSGFFGIGGGPFQVSTLIIFFGLDIKEASVDSIFITFLTTISSLAKYTLNGYTDFSLAVYMIPAAILGGYIGSRLNRKINEKKIALIFISSVLLILTVQTYIVITRYLAFIK
ncbi:MAG: sulfite exporter TauE/SafE family protein [Sebaldella sp.]|nr:sulfite exporter TauE/SafE family protein [Sebaldella sp.]